MTILRRQVPHGCLFSQLPEGRGDVMRTVHAPFDRATAIADDLLYRESPRRTGSVTAPSGRARPDWQFGILAPPAYAMAHPSERSHAHAECLLDAGFDATLRIRVRFLQMVARTRSRRGSDGRFAAVDRAVLDDAEPRSWDEVVPREVDDEVTVADLLAASRGTADPEIEQPRWSWTHLGAPGRPDLWTRPALADAGLTARIGRGHITEIHAPGGRQVQPAPDGGDETAPRVVWDSWPVRGELRLSAGLQTGPHHLIRLRAELLNTSGWHLPSPEPGSHESLQARQRRRHGQALRRSLIGAHFLLSTTDGHFLSLAAPPRWAARYAGDCVNAGLWPALVGTDDGHDTVLAAPAVLPDFPVIATVPG
jgi:hypothetical protein